MPRAKQRTPALREHVLHVALSTLADRGVEGFTTRRIAEEASTSIPAVYELFGDKAGLVRELFFEGFRLLGGEFGRFVETADPVADIARVVAVFRRFVVANPVLAQVMFSRPFADFDPSPDDMRAGAVVREFVVGRVKRCVDAGALAGNAVDIAHVILATAQGLAAQEAGGWLGTSKASVDRRWTLAVHAVLSGLRPVDAARLRR